MQNFSIQEIKLLSSLELHEIKRAICKMILASFESYKRENPSCPVLISFSLTIKAQLNSLSGEWWKRQNWLLLRQWLNTKFKQLLAAIGAPSRGEETRGASFHWLDVLEVSLGPDIKQQHLWKLTPLRGLYQRSLLHLSLQYQYVYANVLWLTLIEDVSDTLCQHMHMQAHVIGTDSHL